MAERKKKPVEANDGSYAGQVLAAYDDLSDDEDECFMCGGSGFLDDECECSAFEDTCCCLEPTPRECPECRRERLKKVAKEPRGLDRRRSCRAANRQHTRRRVQ